MYPDVGVVIKVFPDSERSSYEVEKDFYESCSAIQGRAMPKLIAAGTSSDQSLLLVMSYVGKSIGIEDMDDLDKQASAVPCFSKAVSCLLNTIKGNRSERYLYRAWLRPGHEKLMMFMVSHVIPHLREARKFLVNESTSSNPSFPPAHGVFYLLWMSLPLASQAGSLPIQLLVNSYF